MHLSVRVGARSNVAVIGREPALLVQRGDGRRPRLMPRTADVEREFALCLAGLEHVVHRSCRHHRPVQLDGVERACGGARGRCGGRPCHPIPPPRDQLRPAPHPPPYPPHVAPFATQGPPPRSPAPPPRAPPPPLAPPTPQP